MSETELGAIFCLSIRMQSHRQEKTDSETKPIAIAWSTSHHITPTRISTIAMTNHKEMSCAYLHTHVSARPVF